MTVRRARAGRPDVPAAPRNWRTGQPLTYDLTHSDEVFFLERQGRERFLPDRSTPQGHKNLTHPDSLARTRPQELDVLSWLTDRAIGRPSSS